MPELPEVETVKEILKRQILGLRIEKVIIRYDKIIKEDISGFISKIEGRVFLDIKRKGKYLIFNFGEMNLVSHLRMEGKYFIKKTQEPYNQHEHVIFQLSNGYDLRYHDTRKFGTMETKTSDELYVIPPLSELAKEPFDITIPEFKRNFKNKNIKEVLLDQHIIAGIGNIYADEICFLSHLYPSVKANSLTDEQLLQIISNAIDVLNRAIALGGTTIRSYTSSLGVTGRFQQELNVHMREGKSCNFCRTTIEKTVISGRGTYYCPKCQRGW